MTPTWHGACNDLSRGAGLPAPVTRAQEAGKLLRQTWLAPLEEVMSPVTINTVPQPRGKTPIYAHLYFQVIVAITIGILLGHYYPDIGTSMKPLGDAFIK